LQGSDSEALEQNHRALKAVEGKAELPPHMLPMLVRFRDASEPTTVEQVQPAELAEAFGPGTSLRGVTVEMTNDPVSAGIERHLPWLRELRGPLDGSNLMYPNGPLANRIGSGDFRIE
jgi:hypothetical protein